MRPSFLGAIFFASGAASLVYQVVWQRLLSVHYGVGAVSTTVIVSVFMLGLGMGSIAGGFLAERWNARIAHYMALEALIGAFGIASLPVLRLLGTATAGSDLVTSTLYVALFLLVPTILMGMTLPVVVKILSREMPDIASSLGWFYYVNTLGAAFGAVFATYVLIAALGLDGATYAAVATNFVLAIVVRRTRATHLPKPAVERTRDADDAIAPSFIYATVLVTGFLAIGYQIVWFRVIGVLLKDSPYAFATTLAVYLLGIARGSAWLYRKRDPFRARDLFFKLNGAIGASALGITWAFYFAARYTPLADVLRSLATRSVLPAPPSEGLGAVLATLVLVIGLPMLFLNAPTFFMGASFPLAASLFPRSKETPAAAAGTAYFITIVGNVAGGIVTGLVLLPRLGTERVLAIYGCIGLLFFAFVEHWRGRVVPRSRRIAAVVAAVAFAWLVAPKKGGLWEAMHFSSLADARLEIEEGTEGVVATFHRDDNVRNTINGSTHGGRPFPAFWREAAIALGYAPSPKRVLVIGFGTGSVHEIALLDPRVERVTLAEVNATLLRNLHKVPTLHAMLDHPRTEIVVDDARRYLVRTNETFDAILMDPLRTASALSNNLYSREFLELAKSRLAPDGVLLVWTDETNILPRTVATVFEQVAYHVCDDHSWAFLVAAAGPRALGLAHAQSYPERIEHGMASVQCPRTANRDDILRRTDGLPINTTYRPRTEYYLR